MQHTSEGFLGCRGCPSRQRECVLGTNEALVALSTSKSASQKQYLHSSSKWRAGLLSTMPGRNFNACRCSTEGGCAAGSHGGIAESPGCCPWECPLQEPPRRCCCPRSKVTGEGDCGQFCSDEVPTLLFPSVKMNSHNLRALQGRWWHRERCW